jgi:hypothetical protein
MDNGLCQELRIGQFAPLDHGIRGHEVRVVGRPQVGQGVERQTKADRRISRHQEQVPAPGLPDLAEPARRCSLGGPALHRQHVADRRAKLPFEGTHDAIALERVIDLGIAGIDILRKLALLEHALGRVFEDGLHVDGVKPKAGRDGLRETLGVASERPIGVGLGRNQRGLAPNGLAVPRRQ